MQQPHSSSSEVTDASAFKKLIAIEVITLNIKVYNKSVFIIKNLPDNTPVKAESIWAFCNKLRLG